MTSANAPMSREELLSLPATTDIETAARALGIGRTTAFQLARADDFPCEIEKVGGKYRVITADLHRVLGVAPVTPVEVESASMPARMAANELERAVNSLARDASRLAEEAQRFAAGLVHGDRVSGSASGLAQQAVQLAVSAARVDALRDTIAYLDTSATEQPPAQS